MEQVQNVKGNEGQTKRTPEDQSISPCLLLSVSRGPRVRKALTLFSLEEKTGSRPFVMEQSKNDTNRRIAHRERRERVFLKPAKSLNPRVVRGMMLPENL